MVPRCGEPEKYNSGNNTRQGFGQRIIVSITLDWAAHTSSSLMVDSPVARMSGIISARIQRFGGFEIRWRESYASQCDISTTITTDGQRGVQFRAMSCILQVPTIGERKG